MLFFLVLSVFAATFLVVALAVIVVAMVQRRRDPEAIDVPNSDIFKRDESSDIGVWRQILDRLDFTPLLKRRISEAGSDWTVGRLTLAMLLLGTVFFAFAFDQSWIPSGVALVAAWFGGSIPYWLLLSKRKKRLRKIEAQFPDALDSLARALRAGHALSSGILMLGQEAAAPLGPEFRKLAEEHRLGLAWDIALPNFANRLPVLEVRMFVAAVLVQNKTGGRLTEVIERLGENIRESTSLRGEVRAISAQGRLTGTILTAMPLFIGTAMYISNPKYIGILFTDPVGNRLVWAAAGCMIAGHFVIQWIVDVKAPQ